MLVNEVVNSASIALAATAKEQEIASNATNPGGGSAGGADEKTTAEKIAEKMFSGQKQENNIISHYVGGN